MATPSKRVELRPVRPNAGLQAAYRRRLDALIAEMQTSIAYWLTASYRANAPAMAADGAFENLSGALRDLSERWQEKFDEGAEKLGAWFARQVRKYVDPTLKAAVVEVGYTVPFQMTEPVQAAYSAVIGEQVALIKSIGSQHLAQVEQLVMQSVQNGRDLKYLTDELQNRYELTRRRAAFIARDQNNKATSVITRTRHQQLGITQGKWRHSAAGRKPRPSHVHANGEIFDIAKGMYLDGVWTWPGMEPNCRCTYSPIIPGL